MPDEEIIYFDFFFLFFSLSEIFHDCYAKLSIRRERESADCCAREREREKGNRKLFLNNNTTTYQAPATTTHHFNFIMHDENKYIFYRHLSCAISQSAGGAIHQIIQHKKGKPFYCAKLC
jgi:hypothetical protein